ncbi:MAG: ABC transporter substrate-binding protein [Vulcanimicrobiaceae bacterium]
MKSAFAILLGVALLAGCTRIATENAVRGGRHAWTVPHVLRFADVADPDRLNPYLSEMDITYDLSSMIFSYLVVANDRGRLVGDLATEVPTLADGGISPDGKTYVYHLRRGVKWQDGAPFTSRDVKFSWEAVVNPRNDTLYREGYDRVASIDTPDAYTVVVHLKRRYPPFVSLFFTPLQEGGKPILPAHILAKYRSIDRVPFDSAPIGTGPFKFVKWERGREIVLARNDDYFKGRPRLAKIVFYVIPNDETMLDEMRLHQIDLITAPQAALYEQYESIPGAVVETVPWNAQNVLVMNERHAGLGDLTVRMALAMSIDYRALARKLTHGVGEATGAVEPPTAIGYLDLPPYRYDPAAANRMLDAAGWRRGPGGVRVKNGVRLDYDIAVIAGSSNIRLAALQLQQYFAAIGVRLHLKTYPYNTIFSYDGPIFTGRYDFADYSTTLSWDPNNLVYLGCDRWYPRGQNVYGYCNRELDALERAGLATDAPRARAAIYRRAERLIHATVPYIPLYQLRRLVVRSVDLRHFKTNPTSTPWYNIWQWDI